MLWPKAHGKVFNVLVISEKQIKILIKHHYLLTKMIQCNNTKCWKGCGVTGTGIP